MSSEPQRPRSPNARLQDRIILYLGGHKDVETVAGLSRILESPRSSTSRAINRLKTEGLVQKVEGTWALTDAGKREEVRLRPRIQERSEKTHEAIRRAISAESAIHKAMNGKSAIQEALGTASAIQGMLNTESAFQGAMGAESAFQKAAGAESAIRKAMSGESAIQKVINGESMIGRVAHGESAFQKAMGAESAIRRAMSGESVIGQALGGQSAIQKAMDAVGGSAMEQAMGPLGSKPFRANYQVRPFFEAMRLVESVGVGDSAISSALRSVTETVRTNPPAYMRAISKPALAGSLTPNTLGSLSKSLDLIHWKLGESAFASIQVRAVKDLLDLIPSSTISSDVFDTFASQVDFASGSVVKKILEQMDAGTLLDDGGATTGIASEELTDEPSTPLGDARSAFLWQNWDDLPEVVKLRFVAVATFIILHVALAAAQHQPDDSQYVKDLIHALGGTAAVVQICRELEWFKDE